MRHRLLSGTLTAGLALSALAAYNGYASPPTPALKKGPGIPIAAHIDAGGTPPPGHRLRNPFKGNARVARAGRGMFKAMHCAGCHGGKAGGLMGPSLRDHRWHFGGTDSAIFQSIFYGRPNGMPAFGGVLRQKEIWSLVTYLESLKRPKDEPTESWGHSHGSHSK